MNILHLNSYFIDNKLYGVLYRKMDDHCKQYVFIPIKKNRSATNEIRLTHGELFFRKVISKYHRFLYKGKLRSCLKELEDLQLIEKADFVHAHNLFGDGGLAYRLKERYGLNYVVAVRLTDTELQYRYMIQRRPFIHKVLLNAEKIIFISPQSRNSLLTMLPESMVKKVKKKIVIIPNGLDDFWMRNMVPKRTLVRRKTFNLLFVGRIIPLKNIDLIIDAVKALKKKARFDIKLTIVGGMSVGNEMYYHKFLQKIEGCEYIDYCNEIRDKEILLEIYRNADAFILPSKAELFGVTYLEALSQGLPVIYSSSSGIKGFIEHQNVGVELDALDAVSVARAIEKVYMEYDQFEISREFIKTFDWDEISRCLIQYYQGTPVVGRELIHM